MGLRRVPFVTMTYRFLVGDSTLDTKPVFAFPDVPTFVCRVTHPLSDKSFFASCDNFRALGCPTETFTALSKLCL